jgi:hypothetical protein
MNRVSVAVVNAVAASVVVPMDRRLDPFSVGIMVTITGGTATYTVQHTLDDVWSPTFVPASANWDPHPTLVNLTAQADGNYAFPVSAIRLNVTVVSGATVTMNVIQAGL